MSFIPNVNWCPLCRARVAATAEVYGFAGRHQTYRVHARCYRLAVEEMGSEAARGRINRAIAEYEALEEEI